MATLYKNMKAKVWLYPGHAGWHFITLPARQARQIKKLFGGMAGGFGSLPVEVSVGRTTWSTSIFPDKKSGSYVLPLKADVRKKENISAEKTITLTLRIKV